jgi:energy-coupling factor transporter transmembrane protein EcfT
METVNSLKYEKKAVIPTDPRTKLLLTITVSTIMITGGRSGWMDLIRPCLALCPIILLLLSKKWKAVIRFTTVYIILFVLELTVLSLLTGVWNFILGAAVGIYTHMLPGFIMGYYLVSTTTVSEFVAAMERMKIPQKIVIPITVVFRFFPTLKEEYAAICDAMKMRGITSFHSPIKTLEYHIVPLLISTAKIGEELSAAALTRGLGAPQKRTNICRIGFGPLDIFFFVLMLPCWGCFFIS